MTEAPRDWSSKDVVDEPHEHPKDLDSRQAVFKAWLPWVILSVFVFLWGVPQIKAMLDGIWIAKFPVAGLDNLVQKMPPVVAEPHLEAAVFNLNLLSATGTGIFLAAIVAGLVIAESGHGHHVLELVRPFRDVFAMTFFVSIGMTIEPAELVSELPTIAAFTAVVLVVSSQRSSCVARWPLFSCAALRLVYALLAPNVALVMFSVPPK